MEGFNGIGHVRVLRTLGSGSYGVVYAAWDEDRQQTVALKRLVRVNAEALFQFKQEFRLLADMTHPNLVGLYELYGEGDQCAFTMEYVDGQPFSAWVRGDKPRTPDERTSQSRLDESLSERSLALPGDLATWTTDHGLDPHPLPATLEPSQMRNVERLRRPLVQLVEGVAALHASGKLHLDLKSSNVLVTPEGRVVVLDFGLTREHEPQVTPGHRELRVAGTPSHLAPEMVEGFQATEASDWYGVGVMVYEALTGRLPFLGTATEMLRAKVLHDPPSPLELCPELPEDLARLCEAMVQRDPSRRPTPEAILAALGSTSEEPVPRRAKRHLVGREHELGVLQSALSALRTGGFRAALVHGDSGMGKSFLIRRFLQGVHQKTPRAIALLGRCFEQESVPFKALDNLIDGLSESLKQFPLGEMNALLPRHVRPLAKLFPVLRQVPAIAQAADQGSEEGDAQEIRRRAFGALRELLSRLGDSRPVVLALDDLQWADQDSIALLSDLFRPPDPPKVLLVVCWRTEGTDGAPAIQGFLKALEDAGSPLDTLAIRALPLQASQDLASSLVGDPTLAQSIAQEAEGNPWLIQELALQALDQRGAPSAGSDFDHLVMARAEGLPDHAREVLRILAVAGYPVPWDLVRRASKPQAGEGDPISLLRSHHLVRVRGTPRHRVLETYHDRVRSALVSHLSQEERKACHLRLARALESSPQNDPQALANHYLAAGETVLAADYAARAGLLAAESLAFERAAVLFRQSIDLRPLTDSRLPVLRTSLADALANAGRGAEAGEVYLQAAIEGEPTEAPRLRRRAAEEYFRSGHFALGLETAQPLLARLGVRIPPTPARAMLSLLFHRFRLWWRGMAYTERKATEVPSALLERIDILWSMAMGLGPFDVIRATDFQTRQLLLALEAGEPMRLVRAFAHETVFRATEGVAAWPVVHPLQARTFALAERIGRPEALARAQLAAGLAAMSTGKWRAGMEWAERAEETLQQGCIGVNLELHAAQLYAIWNAVLVGDLPKAQRRFPGLLQESRSQGDLLMSTNLVIAVGAVLRLASDQPGRAHQDLTLAMEGWPQGHFLLQHWEHLQARTNILLYEGKGEEALALVNGEWQALERSFLLKVQTLRVTAHELRARALIVTGQDQAMAAIVKTMAREDCDYGQALALKNQGILAARSGRKGEATDRLLQAEMALRQCELPLQAESVRRVRGTFLGGKVGRELVAQADGWMQERNILNPERMARMLAPGLD